MKKSRRWAAFWLSLILGLTIALAGCSGAAGAGPEWAEQRISLAEIPPYSGEPYVVVNGNVPELEEEEPVSYESYSQLDGLGRCGTAEATIGKDLMPTEKRGYIGSVKPSGWHTTKYEHVDGKNLYNRCHLIGYQLTAENANEKNLITGTRYMNVEGMLPFENMVADYIRETGNHVQYRVTPVYQSNDLVASGVQMEARSVEDEGEGVSYNVYVYNVQPGIEIDYATGESWEADWGTDGAEAGEKREYILNTGTKRIHLPGCSGAISMKKENRKSFTGTKEELEAMGYKPCGSCKP